MTRPIVSAPAMLRCLSAGLMTIGLVTGQLAIGRAGVEGHGNGFQGSSTTSTGTVQVDAETAKRLGFKVEPVTRQRLAFGIRTTGQIETLPNRQVEVTTPVGGTVVRLLVKPGDAVKEGQPVALMTSPDLAQLRTDALDRESDATGAVQQAQVDLQLAQENVAQQRKIAEQEVKQAQTAFTFAQDRYAKDQQLAQTGALPQRTALESGTKLAEAQTNLARAESRLTVTEAQAQRKRAEAALATARSRVTLSGQTYNTRLRQLGASATTDGMLTLKAPITGQVVERATTPGESGQDAGKRILTIVNGSSVQVSGNVYEKDVSRIRVGQRVRIKVNGLPNRTFDGKISVVAPTVQGESRVVAVKATLNNADDALKPGQFAEIEILTDRTPVRVLAIPKAAIVETTAQKKIVFVQNGTAFQATEVTLGRESGKLVEITQGLFDGDQVVTQRAPQLYTQSLRGDATAMTDHGGHGAMSSPPPERNLAGLPWWSLLLGATPIVAGTFWAGTRWAARRDRRQPLTQPTRQPLGDVPQPLAQPTREPLGDVPVSSASHRASAQIHIRPTVGKLKHSRNSHSN